MVSQRQYYDLSDVTESPTVQNLDQWTSVFQQSNAQTLVDACAEALKMKLKQQFSGYLEGAAEKGGLFKSIVDCAQQSNQQYNEYKFSPDSDALDGHQFGLEYPGNIFEYQKLCRDGTKKPFVPGKYNLRVPAMNDVAAVAANSSFVLFNQNDFMIFACANENDCNDWIEVIQYYCSGLDQQIVQSYKQFIETESADQLAQLH